MSTYHYGDVYYIERFETCGSEQYSDRPAVIVSNELNNRYGSTVEIVYLTTQPKEDLPTHVTIYSTGRLSTVLCEQITAVDVSRIKNYLCTVTPANFPKSNGLFLLPLDSGIFPSQSMLQRAPK
ncbi:type II toxin-antitoxin system PemK/MazF family toxin [Intestinibacillus sp. Marseille-P6563]|uniref:type II toxin-antitoxin system PemK/MazF family toxin n=1 Tax=Intestinibacillus sp. Marseille-P6563 TaxID=2364792 RepID=UPI000F0524A4|nr:type II toxin-antitoxin system PemK/MazF family toxin [Intestinibacillus sp. Marseille-P6563]